MSALPDELARLGEDAALALLDVRSTELHRAGGVEESAVLRRISKQFELCAYGLTQVRREWQRGPN